MTRTRVRLVLRGDIAAAAYLSSAGITILEHLGPGEFIIKDDSVLAHVSVVIGLFDLEIRLRSWWVGGRPGRLKALQRYRNETYTGGDLRLDILQIMPTGESKARIAHVKEEVS